MIRVTALLLALLAPWPALAQALQCAVPTRLPEWRAEGPTEREPRRLIKTASYTLAVSWSPGFCRSRGNGANARFQCASDNRFGFVLHGLWPDGAGKEWPQYCRTAPALPTPVIRQNLCVTPSAQLIQHEWAKHGTCMAASPERYFGRSRALFQSLRFPDLRALSRRRGLTAGQVATAVARRNPGMTARAMRVTADRQGWLDELWICLDLTFKPVACPAHQGGLTPNTPVKIWRGRA